MDGIVCDESKQKLLDQRVLAPPFNGNVYMGLSTTNITPTRTTVAGDLTPGEVSVGGYARQQLTTWGAAVLSGAVATALAAAVTFLNTSGGDTGTIYTWFFIDTATGKLVMAGRFSVPFVLVATIGTYTTTPFWRLNGDT